MAVLILRGSEGQQILSLNLCFHTITSEQITLSTDITDHIVEDHTSIQDHITIKPMTYTMRGLIAEKCFVHPDYAYVEIPPERLTAKLTPLKILAPKVNSYVQSAINLYEAIKNKVIQFYNIGKNILSLWQYFRHRTVAKIFPTTLQYDQRHKKWSDDMLQKEIIEVLNDFRINRIPVDISTGWGINFTQNAGYNFYITDVSITQENTYQQSELSVTVKELRFATTQTVALDKEMSERLKQQSEDMKNTVTGSIDVDSDKTKWARETDARNNGNN